MVTQMHPLLEKIIPAAEALVERENFSFENLCHAVDHPLRDVVEAIGSMDELVAHLNGRFMAAYTAKAVLIDAHTPEDLPALSALAAAWLDHALANAQRMNLLLQHKWEDGYERPDWYLAKVKSCFSPVEMRLARLAPQVAQEIVTGIARGIYAHVCGLYFLSTNERARPAGIESLRKLLDLHVATLVKGLQAE
jgi:hypothetical protein